MNSENQNVNLTNNDTDDLPQTDFGTMPVSLLGDPRPAIREPFETVTRCIEKCRRHRAWRVRFLANYAARVLDTPKGEAIPAHTEVHRKELEELRVRHDEEEVSVLQTLLLGLIPIYIEESFSFGCATVHFRQMFRVPLSSGEYPSGHAGMYDYQAAAIGFLAMCSERGAKMTDAQKDEVTKVGLAVVDRWLTIQWLMPCCVTVIAGLERLEHPSLAKELGSRLEKLDMASFLAQSDWRGEREYVALNESVLYCAHVISRAVQSGKLTSADALVPFRHLWKLSIRLDKIREKKMKYYPGDPRIEREYGDSYLPYIFRKLFGEEWRSKM